MKSQLRRKIHEAYPVDGPEVGTLRRIAEDGSPFVEFTGSQGEIIARCAAAAVPPADQCVGAAVLLVFERGDRNLPIIAGFVRASLWDAAGQSTRLAADAKLSSKLEGNTVVIEGKDAVEIRCGQGSISLRADGHVVIKGEKVTSRARETNKVRGATVLIN
jgi:Domain of unknown function (DUF6484)